MELSPLEPRAIIVEQLATVAEARAAQLGLEYAANAIPLVRRLIEGAADRMVRQELATDEGLSSAVHAMGMLVEALGTEAQRRGKSEIDEEVFLSVIRLFCPRPPIC